MGLFERSGLYTGMTEAHLSCIKDFELKFVCYKEFDDPAEPTFPGLYYKGKTLPLARVVAVAEAFHPTGNPIPDDINELIQLFGTFAGMLKDLEKKKVLDHIWQEVGITLVAPLPRPNRILAIGRNYADHAAELGNESPTEPIVFLKASSSVIGHESPIVLPSNVGRVDFEGELAVVIGKSGQNISEHDALSFVAGYTLFNDVTARDMQKRDLARGLPWFLSKGLDTFGPMGPYIVTPDEVKDPQSLELTVTVNGEVVQQVNTSKMIFSVAQIIAYLSAKIALEPGDVIITGTPSGIAALHAGDIVEVTIPEIGTLRNPVIGAEMSE